MDMKTRRNALIGWATLVIGKKLVLMKLRKPPEPEPKLTKTHKGLIAGAVAIVVGALVWMRVRPGGGDNGGGEPDSGMIEPFPPVTATEPEPAATT